MRYCNISHYRKFYNIDDDLMTNNVLAGRQVASCLYTDIKPMTTESDDVDGHHNLKSKGLTTWIQIKKVLEILMGGNMKPLPLQ